MIYTYPLLSPDGSPEGEVIFDDTAHSIEIYADDPEAGKRLSVFLERLVHIIGPTAPELRGRPILDGNVEYRGFPRDEIRFFRQAVRDWNRQATKGFKMWTGGLKVTFGEPDIKRPAVITWKSRGGYQEEEILTAPRKSAGKIEAEYRELHPDRIAVKVTFLGLCCPTCQAVPATWAPYEPGTPNKDDGGWIIACQACGLQASGKSLEDVVMAWVKFDRG